MELEDLKSTWEEMSASSLQRDFLPEEHIRRITHEKSSSRLNKIILFESIGMLVASVMTVYLLVNFHKLDNWLNLIGGYGTLAILLISIAMGINLIREALQINIIKNSYSKTLKNFNAFKKSLGFYKRMSIGINLIFPFLLLPVFSTLWLEKNLLEDLGEFTESIIASFLLIPVLMYVLIRFYRKNISKISKAFKEMENH